ncbi:ATP phosphoribosyltransferase regulatory subunit [Streptomyces sp. NPDC052051]|uniref:ATP phosphoribosyltransferase regulatory subunit n=1 Tax=Streptomyces sp. NPDC052051 TaxID=3154649 RepID=UPI003449B271
MPLRFDAELPRVIHDVMTCLELASVRATHATVVDAVQATGVRSELLAEGLDEMAFVMEALSDLPEGSVVADLSIARGLDYYTGTVYEGKFKDWPNYGSICSGGRYAGDPSSAGTCQVSACRSA